MHLRYTSGTAKTARQVDPYGVVFHWNRWYLAAWCHLRGAMLVFRLDRVTLIEVLPETFPRLLAFDSGTFVTQSLAMAPWGWEVGVLLETTLEQVAQHLSPG